MSRGKREDCSSHPGRRASPQESSTQEVAETTQRERSETREPLGSCIRARFAEIGLDEDLPELRGEVARPATFEK
jgi:hypothetical protein